MFFIESILAISAIVFAIYKLLTMNDDFFKKREVKFEKPTPLFGNMLGLYTGRFDGMSVFQHLYDKFRSEKVWGMFLFMRPIFLIKDVELIKQITVKDFDYFMNHDSKFSAHGDRYFARSVLFLEDNLWREMRNALSPIFTSAKLKTMYHHLTACAQDLTEFLEDTLNREKKIIIDSKDVFARFTAEVISTTSLGFKGNCLKDKHSPVYKLALDVQEDTASGIGALKLVLIQTFPNFVKWLGLKVFRQSIHDFFKEYVADEMARREREGVTDRKDVIQLLIQAKQDQLKTGKKTLIDWNDAELMTAQVFIFFAGGFDSTATLMQNMSWELAMNPDIQTELIKEVDEVVATLGSNPISYEALNQMKFMDMVVSETSRKWPPFPLNQRECNKDYKHITEDGTKIEFKKGDQIFIPTQPIQRDPKYFPNPQKFDPFRFSDDNKHSIESGSIHTFGFGPRICLGMRLSQMEAKLAFFTILRKYTIEVCSQTPRELVYAASPFSFKDKIFVELKSRK